MEQRFSLRFESGEREGELVPLSASPFTVGRRPENALAISDGSVSGRHAELTIDADGLAVRDLGSTNGTRVAGSRVEQARLAHGDALVFGSVAFAVVDRELADAPAGAADEAAEGQVEVASVRADLLARSGRRSRVGLLIGAALVLVLGAGAWLLFSGEGGPTPRRGRAVVPLEGNLLAAGWSFEDPDDETWSSDPDAPGTFLRRADARQSGQAGMQAELEPEEYATLRSAPLSVREGDTLTVRAALRARDGVAGRAGLEFLREGRDADPGPVFAASAFTSGAAEGGFEEVVLVAPVPPGSTRAHVVVEARAAKLAGGTLDVDDLGVTTAPGAARPAAEVGDFRLYALGDPPQALALYKLTTALLGDAYAHARLEGATPVSVALEVEADARPAVRLVGAGRDPVFSLRVEPALAAGGISTLGPTGHRPHGVEFEREDVTLLLLGAERELVGLRFEAPVAVSGVAQDGGARVHVSLGDLQAFRLQVDFSAERKQAGDLAYAARQAERDGRPGEALRGWTTLLEEYPFDPTQLAEADAARGRLVQAGRERLAAARVALERASFFRLVDLFRRSREAAAEVLADYADTEVGAEAQELLAEIDSGLAVLQTDLDRDEAQRLGAIQAWLEASGSPRLAAEVREYRASEYGEDR